MKLHLWQSSSVKISLLKREFIHNNAYIIKPLEENHKFCRINSTKLELLVIFESSRFLLMVISHLFIYMLYQRIP